MATGRKDDRSDRGGTRDEPTNEIKRQIIGTDSPDHQPGVQVPKDVEPGVAHGHVPGHLGYTSENLINVNRTSRDV